MTPLRILRFLLPLALLAASFGSASAQTEKVKNLPYIDQRRLHFGFLLGMHTQDYAFSHTGAVTDDGQQWFAEIPEFSIGFTVGLVADWAFTEHLNLRLTPSMLFGNKTVWMREQTTRERMTQDVKSNYITLPLLLKYSSHRVNNYRPYITAGISPMMDISKRKDTPLQFNRFDASLEVGLGCDLYLPYFKLIPELRFSLGLSDALRHKRPDLKDPGQTIYTDAIGSAKSRLVSLVFYFE